MKFVISKYDPVFKYEYNTLFLKDKDTKRKFYAELKGCKNYAKKKWKMGIEEKIIKKLKK